MRFSAASAIVLASLALAGCTSSSGLGSLMEQASPSPETTSSVIRPSAAMSRAALRQARSYSLAADSAFRAFVGLLDHVSMQPAGKGAGTLLDE